MRRWHKLPGNATTQAPSTHVFVDTETLGDPAREGGRWGLHTLRLGCAVRVRLENGRPTRREVLRFDRVETWWDWLFAQLDTRRATWVWAHNAGFDLTVLEVWKLWTNREFVRRLAVLDDPPTILRGRWKGRSVTFLDSLNWWRVSLAVLGDQVGVPKLTQPPFDAPDSTWSDYCLRDVEVLEKAVVGVIGWLYEKDLGVMRSTSPGQSLQTYRHRFRMHPIDVHAEDRACIIEREGYYGGQLEVYYKGRVVKSEGLFDRGEAPASRRPKREVCGPVYHLDVNSLFPSVMRGNLFPCHWLGFTRGPPVQHMKELLSEYAVIARVQINGCDAKYPLRDETGVYHPVGRYWTTLAGPELHRALCHNHVAACSAVCWYKLGELFTQYVDYFWSLRKEYEQVGNQLYATLCKTMLNALYGKFAQRIGRWVDKKDLMAPEPWGGYVRVDPVSKLPIKMRSVGWAVQQEGGEEDAPHTFTAISAYVTSYARERMRWLRRVCGQRQVLYQATDSLHVLQQGYDRLVAAGEVDADQLGSLRLVETAEEGEYWGPNHYRLGSKVCLPGIARNAQLQPDGSYLQPEFQRLDSIIATEPLPGVQVRPINKKLTFPPVRGTVGPDGWVRPVVLGAEKGGEQ